MLLAVPHLASAVGFAFLITPSGWLARLASPWLTGWQRPPDLLTLNDPWGVALTMGLALREAPFLLFALLAAAGQTDVGRQLRVARSLGYGPAEAWVKLALPQLFPLLRLPLYAVLAFTLSAVDVALVLGPAAPAPLAVELVRLAQRPRPRQAPAGGGRRPAAAGADGRPGGGGTLGRDAGAAWAGRGSRAARRRGSSGRCGPSVPPPPS